MVDMTTQEDAANRPARCLIVGASRGLGLAIAAELLGRGWQVVGTVREGGPTELHKLRESSNERLEIETIDINLVDHISALRTRLHGTTFDLLLVNAGVKNDDGETIGDVSTDEFTRVMVTNALSPMRVDEALRDLVHAGGTIAVMSSGQGSIANNESGGFEVYRASKAALNTLMRSHAARHASDDRTLLLVAPGWIRTDMGGPSAPYSVEESIPSLVTTIEAQRGRGGLQYLDRHGNTVPW
jgi:NAD(P)-dependent dehydrogenase (short-subunit alcohol dehydrogenase family)